MVTLGFAGAFIAGMILEYLWIKKARPALARWADNIRKSDIPKEWRLTDLT